MSVHRYFNQNPLFTRSRGTRFSINGIIFTSIGVLEGTGDNGEGEDLRDDVNNVDVVVVASVVD